MRRTPKPDTRRGDDIQHGPLGHVVRRMTPALGWWLGACTKYKPRTHQSYRHIDSHEDEKTGDDKHGATITGRRAVVGSGIRAMQREQEQRSKKCRNDE
ncbi:MAG TPA: hypothetical protein VGH80_08160 [Xanthomonadaceae bacterium]|jgi:hypothetical protein